MNSDVESLPYYEKPPVTEVVLSVQFQPLRNLRSPFIGFLWKEYQEKGLINVEEKIPLKPVIELFGEQQFIQEIEITHLPPVPRCWFINEDRSEIVQVQNDRLVHNWIKTPDNPKYPRYDQIRKDFLRDLEIFQEFLHKYNVGKLIPNQCEITYVNTIPVKVDNNVEDNLENIFNFYSFNLFDNFLPGLENAESEFTYVIRDEEDKPIGRLHIVIKTMSGEKNSQEIKLSLTVRGKPDGDDIEDILEVFDIGHEWIVKSFTSFTSENMHRIWEYKNGY